MNLTDLLDEAARHWPQKPALAEGSDMVSYAELIRQIDALAARLGEQGIGAGMRVGVCQPNSILHVVLTFALWRLNAIVVPVPIECTPEEVAEIAAAMRLQALISRKADAAAAKLGPDCQLARLTPATPPDNHGLNIAFIRFTSGTTSQRKGVVLGHETIRDRVLAANHSMGITENDVVMWCLPMAHHFLSTIVLYLSRGATIVLARHVLARAFLEAINRWQGTVLYAAPFQYALLAREDSAATLPSVRLAVSTTCALTEDVAQDFHRRFGRPLVQALGIIELGLVSANLTDPLKRWNSVGRPAGPYRLRILHQDKSGCGEVAFSGPGFFDAYADPWLPRERVLRDGWFHTGDIGRLDADGFLFLIGRKAAVINLAGRKVFPEEIEAVLNRHPAIRESRVYGRPHAHLGEVVEAEIVPEEPGIDLDDVREFCRANLASFKIPTSLRVVSALPRTAATGKIRRVAAVAQHD